MIILNAQTHEFVQCLRLTWFERVQFSPNEKPFHGVNLSEILLNQNIGI